MEQVERLISLYSLGDWNLWRYVLLPPAGGALLLALLWTLVRKRSRSARRLAILVSAAAPGIVWLMLMLPAARNDLAAWLAALVGVLLVCGAGYLVLNEWEGLVRRSRDRRPLPDADGIAPQVQKKLERRAAIQLGVFALLLLASVLYLVSR
ncbi:MAG: hypothetical protein Kow0067_16360 [Coriobacteriia bacterium]